MRGRSSIFVGLLLARVSAARPRPRARRARGRLPRMPRARAPAARPDRRAIRLGTAGRRHDRGGRAPAPRRTPPPPFRRAPHPPFRPEGDPDDSSLAGRSIRRAPHPARAHVQPRGRCHAGVDHRRHHRGLHGGQRRAAARTAVPRSRGPGLAAAGVSENADRLFDARLSRARIARRLLRVRRGVSQS